MLARAKVLKSERGDVWKGNEGLTAIEIAERSFLLAPSDADLSFRLAANHAVARSLGGYSASNNPSSLSRFVRNDFGRGEERISSQLSFLYWTHISNITNDWRIEVVNLPINFYITWYDQFHMHYRKPPGVIVSMGGPNFVGFFVAAIGKGTSNLLFRYGDIGQCPLDGIEERQFEMISEIYRSRHP